MEENEYVRTDKGELAIVTSVMKGTMGEILGTSDFSNIGFCNTEPYVYGNIIKHSENIIDLIEVRRLCEWFKSYKKRLSFIILG